MKMKGFWKKFIAKVLTAVMMISVFSTVDMGWNVMEVKAEYVTSGILFTETEGTTFNQGTWVLNGDTLEVDYTGGKGGARMDFVQSTTQKDSVLNKALVKKVIVKSGYYGLNIGGMFNDFSNLTEIEINGTSSVSGRSMVSILGYYNKIPTLETIRLDGNFSTSDASVFINVGTQDKPVTLILGDNFNWSYSYWFSGIGTDVAIEENRKGTVNWLGGWFKFPHAHSWKYTASGNKVTATCNGADTCPQNYKTNGFSMSLKAPSSLVYNGSSKAYTIENWTPAPPSGLTPALATKPTTVSYKNRTGTAAYNSTTAPTNAGDYTAQFTVGGATAKVDFTITKIDPKKEDFTYIGPTNLVYDKNPKTATVTAKSGKTTGKITIEYYNSSGQKLTSAPVEAGTYKVKISVAADTNYNAATLEMGTFTITRADYSSEKTASGTLKLVTGKTTEITLPTLPTGATYGSVTNGNTSYFTVGEVTDGKVLVTAAKNGYADTDSGNKDFTIAVNAAATVYNNYNITVTITPEFHTHSFLFSVPDSAKNTIVAECSNDDGDCFLPDYKTTIALTADDRDYTGNAYIGASADSTEWASARLSVPTIMYESIDGTAYTKQSTAPTNSGEYKATITFTDNGTNYTAESEFKIEKAAQSATVRVEDYTWGGELPAPTISGEEESATPTYYYNTKNSNEGGKAWTGLTSVLLDNGTYYVYAELSETANYKAGKTAATAFTINGKAFDSNITKSPFNGTYDKQPHTIVFSVDDNDPTLKITYATSEDGAYSETKPTFTNAGDYTVYYRVKKFGYSLVSGSETVKIAKKGITITPDAGQSKSYGKPDPVLTYTPSEALFTGDKFAGALTYNGASVNANVGEYAIEMGSLSAGNNYELTLAGDVKFKITPANYTQGPDIGVGYVIDYEDETLAPSNAADFEIGKKDEDGINEVGSNSVVLTDELSSTPLRDVYYVRYKANSNQGRSPWTAITIPARPAEPNVVDKQETVMKKKDAEITGLNTTMEYKFDGDWTTVSEGTTVLKNPENKNFTIRVKASNANKNFKGLEKSIEFTASTTTLTVKRGDTGATIAEGLSYGDMVSVSKKPTEDPTRDGWEFMYWAYNGVKWKFDGEEGVTSPDKVEDNITLEPIFGFAIDGEIIARNYTYITEVRLEDGKGNKFKASKVVRKIGSNDVWVYHVVALAGVDYNLIVTGKKTLVSGDKSITKTQLIKNLSESTHKDVEMPDGAYSSVLDKDDAGKYENTLVGGVDEIANAHDNISQTVEVKLIVSETTKNNEEIEKEVTGKVLEYVELTLTKRVDTAAPEDIGSSNTQLLEIIIPFSTANKYEFAVYRYHDSKVETLTTSKNEDGEYIEIGKDTITIHAKKFSTYAIGYSETPPYSGPVILSPTDNPTDSDVEEPTDSDTDTPEDPDKPSNSDDSLNNSSGNGANPDSGQGTSAAQIGNNKKSPKTGEETDSFVWYLLMTAGLGVLFLAATKRRQTKERD